MHDVTNTLSLLSASDIQQSFAVYLKQQRKIKKLSRSVLAERSTVPMSTIKKFETTGKISLRQLLLLWQSLDDLTRLQALLNSVESKSSFPKTIDEVLIS
ncbi:XRE family transcriptional regulator [uncultured Shewanella sp.]|uniref:XRE family transcriptional regulator n=1 Tax=uncultured Shewanella sp. TaxID=173975 RepID=UPI002619CBEA|nr:XRE family transcriptional regulator [uncultured Shewanella sp.]